MKASLLILKVGGAVVDDPAMSQKVMERFAAFPGDKILVHGGGKMATNLAAALGVPQTMIEGRRVTNAETLRIAVMVYAGWVNKTLVAHLQSLSCKASGYTGADANLIKSEKRKHALVDFGLVGDILPDGVNVEAFLGLLDKGGVPVLAPITHDGNGQLLNTNADSLASALAKALCPYFNIHLAFTFEKNGVLRDPLLDHSVIPVIHEQMYQRLKLEGVISHGMIPKLDHAFQALASGVSMVTIGNALSWNTINNIQETKLVLHESSL